MREEISAWTVLWHIQGGTVLFQQVTCQSDPSFSDLHLSALVPARRMFEEDLYASPTASPHLVMRCRAAKNGLH